jgi:hypothetical protein
VQLEQGLSEQLDQQSCFVVAEEHFQIQQEDPNQNQVHRLIVAVFVVVVM